MNIQWSDLAIERVDCIALYIAKDSLFYANKWVNDIYDYTDRLEIFPKSARMVSEINDTNLRELIFGNYRIVYRIKSNEILILTVRNFKEILPLNEIK